MSDFASGGVVPGRAVLNGESGCEMLIRACSRVTAALRQMVYRSSPGLLVTPRWAMTKLQQAEWDAKSTGILITPFGRVLTRADRDRIKADWERNYGGPANAHRYMVLP